MQISKDTVKGSPWLTRRYVFLLSFVLAVIFIYCLETLYTDDIFALTPFCDADGICHEKPEKPSPRTIYSAKSKYQFKLWWKSHATLNVTAQQYVERREKEGTNDVQTTRPLILIGDSITESWLGTSMGLPVDRAKGVPQVFKELLADYPGPKLDPLILAIAGDQTQHVLYRLEHGQMLPAYADDPTTIFVVLIGTNNIGSGELPNPATQGILAVADYILSNSQGYLLLLQNLPRGDSFRLPLICPPRCNSAGKPFLSFLPAIEELNQAVEVGVQELGERHGTRRLSLLDCGRSFVSKDGSDVNKNLMPDLLHPNAAGHKLLGECFLSYIRGLEKG